MLLHTHNQVDRKTKYKRLQSSVHTITLSHSINKKIIHSVAKCNTLHSHLPSLKQRYFDAPDTGPRHSKSTNTVQQMLEMQHSHSHDAKLKDLHRYLHLYSTTRMPHSLSTNKSSPIAYTRIT